MRLSVELGLGLGQKELGARAGGAESSLTSAGRRMWVRGVLMNTE